MTITPTISYLSMNVIKRNSGHKKKSYGQKTNFSSVFSARFQIYSSGWRDNAIVTWGNLEKSERFSSGCETETKENNKEDGIPVRSIHQLSYWPTLYRDSEALLGWRYQRTWSASFWSVFCFLVYWGPQLRTQWNLEFLVRCAVKRWLKKSVRISINNTKTKNNTTTRTNRLGDKCQYNCCAILLHWVLTQYLIMTKKNNWHKIQALYEACAAVLNKILEWHVSKRIVHGPWYRKLVRNGDIFYCHGDYDFGTQPTSYYKQQWPQCIVTRDFHEYEEEREWAMP